MGDLVAPCGCPISQKVYRRRGAWENLITAEIPNKYLTPQILSTVSICTDDGANVVKTA